MCCHLQGHTALATAFASRTCWGFLAARMHGQEGKSADLVTCLAGWFLASRGFLTQCERFSLTGPLQGKHVSQPDLHT